MKKILILLALAFSLSTFSQLHAVISVQASISKKLAVKVDLGNTPEQISKGEVYSEKLNKIKSRAAVLNYIATEGYEIIEIYND